MAGIAKDGSLEFYLVNRTVICPFVFPDEFVRGKDKVVHPEAPGGKGEVTQADLQAVHSVPLSPLEDEFPGNGAKFIGFQFFMVNLTATGIHQPCGNLSACRAVLEGVLPGVEHSLEKDRLVRIEGAAVRNQVCVQLVFIRAVFFLIVEIDIVVTGAAGISLRILVCHVHLT